MLWIYCPDLDSSGYALFPLFFYQEYGHIERVGVDLEWEDYLLKSLRAARWLSIRLSVTLHTPIWKDEEYDWAPASLALGMLALARYSYFHKDLGIYIHI
jgi:hypothetical protein